MSMFHFSWLTIVGVALFVLSLLSATTLVFVLRAGRKKNEYLSHRPLILDESDTPAVEGEALEDTFSAEETLCPEDVRVFKERIDEHNH